MIGGACNAHGREKKFVQNFGWKACGEDLEADGRIILKWI
jgi:hypothetical protein